MELGSQQIDAIAPEKKDKSWTDWIWMESIESEIRELFDKVCEFRWRHEAAVSERAGERTSQDIYT